MHVSILYFLSMQIHPMRAHQRDEVAELIHFSTNHWYEQNRGHTIFDPATPLACRLFTDVYEDLDPGCCLLAESDDGKILGSCFYHPRETHVSLGIMNAHPEAAGLGVARKLLSEIVRRADGKPIRLVSSLMNLDSYSLYTKAGFTPRALYQDMQFVSPPDLSQLPAHSGTIREARLNDVEEMADLEMQLTGIRRAMDYRYFIENKRGIWRCHVLEENGKIIGFLNSINHPASQMLGPGVCRDWQGALQLIASHHDNLTGNRPVFLVPALEREMTSLLYAMGARNLELHTSQVFGNYSEPAPGAVISPTFMPETG